MDIAFDDPRRPENRLAYRAAIDPATLQSSRYEPLE